MTGANAQSRAAVAARRRSTGKPPPPWAAYAFGVLFAIGVVFLAQRLADKFGPAEASARVYSYNIVNDAAVDVTIQVRRNPERDTVCLLRSRDRSGAEVGHLDLRIPAEPGGADEVLANGTVRTTGLAVTGESGSCVALEPGAPPPFQDHLGEPPASGTSTAPPS